MDDNELLKEYVLNPVGAIYYGSSGYWGIKARPWNFGQVSFLCGA
jgi:hypothetical protein